MVFAVLGCTALLLSVIGCIKDNTALSVSGQCLGAITLVLILATATDAAIICNEEGRLIGLEPNCTLLGVHFVGSIVVAGVDGEEFTDLPEEGVKVFLDIFGVSR